MKSNKSIFILGLAAILLEIMAIYATGAAPANNVVQSGGYSKTSYALTAKILGIIGVLVSIFILIIVSKKDKPLLLVSSILLVFICIAGAVLAWFISSLSFTF